MELKLIKTNHNKFCIVSFNRTNMELKRKLPLLLVLFELSFNRTNMELKPTKYSQGEIRNLKTFNRTNMELKHMVGVNEGTFKQTFNRTNMELKHRKFWRQRNEFFSFNRTNMELKRTYTLALPATVSLAFNRTNMELKPNRRGLDFYI